MSRDYLAACLGNLQNGGGVSSERTDTVTWANIRYLLLHERCVCVSQRRGDAENKGTAKP